MADLARVLHNHVATAKIFREVNIFLAEESEASIHAGFCSFLKEVGKSSLKGMWLSPMSSPLGRVRWRGMGDVYCDNLPDEEEWVMVVWRPFVTIGNAEDIQAALPELRSSLTVGPF